MLPKTTILQGITNPSTNEAIEIYKMDRNYPRFYRNFLIESDNGRPSLRLANTFSLEIISIKLESIDNNIRPTVAIWVDGEGLLPSTTVCLM
jgi:hypothetical protein